VIDGPPGSERTYEQ